MTTPASMPADQLNETWAAYVEAAGKAQASRKIEDGIAAGRAWALFLRRFEGQAVSPDPASRDNMLTADAVCTGAARREPPKARQTATIKPGASRTRPLLSGAL